MPEFTVDNFREWVVNSRKNNKKRDRTMDHQLKLLEELKVKKHPSAKQVEDTMTEVLCYGDIVYCCSSPENEDGGKECPFRDSILDALGLEHKDFEKFKLDMTQRWYKLLKEKGVTK